jgi:hypothetical protein
MRRDGKNGEPQPREQSFLSDETVEQAKKEILYGAGYQRPPLHTRFKKGQSGNPKGRPRRRNDASGGSGPAQAMVLKEARRPIAVRDGEGIKEMPAIEAVLRAQYAAAVKGNAYAQKHVMERYEQAERERRRQIEETNADWQTYVEAQRAAIAEAEREGQSAPNPLPHPDDVMIDGEEGVRFVGPVTVEEAERLDETCRMRDMLIMRRFCPNIPNARTILTKSVIQCDKRVSQCYSSIRSKKATRFGAINCYAHRIPAIHKVSA